MPRHTNAPSTHFSIIFDIVAIAQLVNKHVFATE